MKLGPAAAISAALGLVACADWKPVDASTAPDGKAVAQIEVALAGASASNKTRVVVRSGTEGELPKPVYVVEADGAIVDRTRLRWSDANHLLVTLCDAKSYRVEAENLRNPPFVDAGRGDGTGVPNAVWVEVVNLTYSEAAKSCVPRAGTM